VTDVIAKASLKYMGTSPQKVRLVVDQIRGKRVEEALSILRFSPKMAARDLEKLLKSAVANAEQREERVDVDRLHVSRAAVDAGPTMKRVRFRAMGRAFRILKRSCHVSLELDLAGGAGAPATKAPATRTDKAPASRKTTARKPTRKAAAKKPAAKKAVGKKTSKKVTKKAAKKAASKKTTKKVTKSSKKTD
jgi:large subunit ribosomal protein L22